MGLSGCFPAAVADQEVLPFTADENQPFFNNALPVCSGNKRAAAGDLNNFDPDQFILKVLPEAAESLTR